MPRKPRFAPPGHYLHITQRGNYGQRTFYTKADHSVFLDLLIRTATASNIDVLAYCLMPNHYHLIARPNEPHAISHAMRDINGPYSRYLHGRLTRTGRLWQDRFYACLLGHTHLLSALRYVEQNPVRAHMVDDPFQYPWSSANSHSPNTWLDDETFRLLVSPEDWPQILAGPQPKKECATIRRTTHTERTLAAPELTTALETEYGVPLTRRAPGRRPTHAPTPPHAPVSSKRPPQSVPYPPAARVTSSA